MSICKEIQKCRAEQKRCYQDWLNTGDEGALLGASDWFGEQEIIMREFETGANRNSEEGKIDYEGFINPLVIKRFGEYMDSHRQLETGQLRDSDNWQRGIPLDSAIKSAWRHFHDWHMEHRGYESREGLEAALCGLLFNVQSYLLTILEEKEGGHWTPIFTQEEFNKALDESPTGPGTGAFADAQQQELFESFEEPDPIAYASDLLGKKAAEYYFEQLDKGIVALNKAAEEPKNNEEEIIDTVGSYPFTETSKNWVEAWPKWFQNVVGAVGKGK